MDLKAIKIDFTDIKTVKWITLAFLSVILVLDFCIFSSLNQATRQAKAQRDKNTTVVGFFKGLVSKKDELKNVAIISQDGIDDLLDEIQGIAGKDNIKANIGVSLDPDTQDKGNYFYARKVFSMDVSGTLKDLGNFLTSLKNLPDAVLDIESASVASDENDISNVQAKLRFVVLTTKDDDNE